MCVCVCVYEGESNENLKYAFILVMYWTQKVHNDFIFLCSILCHLSATLQTMGINVATYKTIKMWFEFLSPF